MDVRLQVQAIALMKRYIFMPIVFVLSVTGCSTVQPPMESPSVLEPVVEQELVVTVRERLKEAKANWKLGNYKAIASREGEVACAESDDGCDKLHLITGHACFRIPNYQCAADHLEAGIKQTTDWDLDGIGLNRQKTYMNLLESLRSSQGTERGDALKKINERLLNMTQEFIALEPQNPAGTFFLVSAQFSRLRGDTAGAKDSRRRCQELGKLLEGLQKAGSPSSNIRYETYYRQLLSDIAGAKQAVSGCS